MKPSIFVLVLTLLSTAVVMADPALSVSYLDGSVFIGSPSSWKTLGMGDSVPADSIIRLDAGASLDLKGMGTDIYLMQKGSYSIRDLFAARQKLGAGGIGAALSSKLNGLLRGPAGSQSVVAGVRGSDEGKGAGGEWMESGVQESIQQAKDEIAAGRYSAAIQRLGSSMDEASADELPELRYTLAFAYSLSGDTLNATRQLAGLAPGEGAAWTGDFVLLQAKLYLDAFAFDQTVQWLGQSWHDLSRDSRRASLYYFFLGMGYRGLGDAADEKRAFANVVAMDADGDMGKAAAQLQANP